MQRQHLAERRSTRSRLRVVSEIAGLHAQLFSSAELTLWARVEGLKRGTVAKDVWETRSLVKTWSQRGTLHLLPARELGLWVAAQGELKARHHVPSWLKHHGLTRELADAILEAIPAALDGEPLSRIELAGRVAEITGADELREKLGGGFGDLLKPAAFRGALCFAPSVGTEVRFTRPDAWLGEVETVDAETATRAVARRYLAAYGPATREAFARWFGMTSAPQAERWIRALGDDVAEVAVEGEAGWMLAADVDAAAAASPSGVVRLVPAFDQYVVGAPRDAPAMLSTEHKARVYRPQAWLSPVLLVDGVMAGVWRHEVVKDRVEVEIEPFAKLGKDVVAGATAEAERLAAFLGGELALRWVKP